ncbi:UTP--glucose-1-phosphate uridylyltransferase GalU [Tuberibacillus sp. Marseille-P3662]|uniref:UTP--glucose-1-phosphate uridylyltransferase GalU n=1 Tax=Tuberibacillus sp. Marseille-P3662 TaxID=1965358 RepID=UPI000A1CD882|nr:UTP--glucose-1-phosphate uridylyltransferase GalU [Tuberibacillus sp. Marseille-P3662]
MSVKKAIIPAAGLGTRFLPATKAQPKEMLPIVDKPTIQYIVEEAAASGIEDIIIISGRGKRAIEDHFDKSYELESTLRTKNKTEMLETINHISSLANVYYIRQKEPLGLGHAVYCASRFIGNEPFAVMLGDDIVKSNKPCLKQLIDVYDQHHSSVVGIQKVPDEDVSKYGIIAPKHDQESSLIELESLEEKPSIEEAPSNLAVMGRYILTPEIFNILSDLPPGSGGEIQLTDAIKVLASSEKVIGYPFDGDRYDVGDKFGFIKATIDFAIERDDLKDGTINYLQQVLEELKSGGKV